MRFYLKINAVLFLLLNLLFSCNKQMPERQRPVGEHMVKVGFEAFSGDSDLKSAVSVGDSYINNVIACIYDTRGMLVGELSFSGGTVGYINLMTGRAYNVYAIANVPHFSAPERESEILSMRYNLARISDLDKSGFPMVSKVQISITGSSLKVRLNMIRLVSRISFTKESSSLPGFKITSVRLMNAPLDASYFKGLSAATATAEGDYATAEDLNVLNGGGAVDFYMLENCQGVLLPDNTDPAKKVPGNLPAAKSELCTYFEVTAVLDGTSGLTGPVTYRFYLGQDLVSDFNVFRNHHNKVTLVVTSGGLDEVSWRIDSDELIPVPVPIMAVGSKGLICYTDENGSVRRQTVGTHTWNDVIFAGGKYVAVGDNGSIAVSSDGVSWDLQIVGTANWQSVAYGNGCFIVAGYYERFVTGSSYTKRIFGYVARSTDAGRWTLTEDADHAWYDIIYGNGAFLASGSYEMWGTSTTSWITKRSSNGSTWYKHDCGSRVYTCLLAGKNEYVALTSGTYVYSYYGQDWSAPNYGGFANIDEVVWDKKRKYVAVGRTGNVVYSSDCRNWSASSVPETKTWYHVTYGKDRFFAVGSGGSAIYSADGETWYKINMGITNTLYSVCVMN